MVLLAVVSSSASAEWIAANRDKSHAVYANPATIRKAGNTVKMWVLEDYETMQGSADMRYMSAKSQHEYNCKKERGRIIYLSLHSEHMGKGKAVYSDNDPGRWEAVASDATGETLLEIACGKP